ncbi:MAG: NAD-dependent epimerase/dehydratase family protein [Alphaproteobacteria bacterium]|nr:NAD-dependent epimerase/dehydratase family protein [Alphaproteobacteria bacterium]
MTGGASFIGSHLVDALVRRGARVTVADDLSSGRLANLEGHLEADRIRFIQVDLRRQDAAETAVAGHQSVFHLAADHGGRGYIETHEAACAANLLLDGMIFKACVESGVERVIYASSGCVYPKNLQADKDNIVRLNENHVGPPYDADGMYGWAKLMGEMALATYAREQDIKAVSCRYFTAYGPRATESHAVIAMIARAFVRQDPFEVWGTGEQVRNWTYISDIVEGTLRAAELADNGEAYNIGTMEGTRVMDAAKMVLKRSGHVSNIQTLPEMPTGPYYRIADNSKLADRTGWRPAIKFEDGLAQTMDWYQAVHSTTDIKTRLPNLLLER